MRIAKHRGGGASRPLFLCRVLITLFVISVHPAAGAAEASPATQTLQSVVDVRAAVSIRFATYNASLNRSGAGELVRDLSTPDNAQARRIAEVIQRVRPDVLLINEFDFDTAGESARLFEQNYLGRAQRNAAPIRYPYRYTAAVNTGVPSGLDLDNDGRIGGGGDALGFGQFPGQYGLVVYSRYPIDLPRVRSFQRFLWRDMPGAVLPPELVLSRRTRRTAAVLEESLGPAAEDRRGQDPAFPGQPSDATRLRRPGRSQRPAQPRRDPAVGGLSDAGEGRLSA